MKKVYYVEANMENSYAEDFVFWLNGKVMATFATRKEAQEWLIKRTRFIKEWWKEDIDKIKYYAKQDNINQVITIDLYKFMVEDDFNIDEDNVWDDDYERSLIDSRYIMGRY